LRDSDCSRSREKEEWLTFTAAPKIAKSRRTSEGNEKGRRRDGSRAEIIGGFKEKENAKTCQLLNRNEAQRGKTDRDRRLSH